MNFKCIPHNSTLPTVTVMVARVFYRRSFAQEEIGLVAKQHEVVGLGFEKDLVQPFLRFPDVLADYTGAIDLVRDKLLFIRCDPCRHGLFEESVGSKATY